MSLPPATLSIDLDDLWSYRRSFGLPEADAPSLLPLAVPRMLEWMHTRGLHCTAFIVGRDAERAEHAPWLQALAAAGHEPGNHSFGHATDIESWAPERQQADLARAHAAITAACGVAPRGFRGPSFRASASLLHAVQAMGYGYDASTFPNALAALARRWQRRQARALGSAIELADDAYGSRATQRLPLTAYRWALDAGPLLELPVTTLPLLRWPMHGTYLQHLADRSVPLARAYAAGAAALCAYSGVAPHMLLHATDFIGADDGLPVDFLPGMRRPWRDKLALMGHLLGALQSRFELMPMGRFAHLCMRQTGLPLLPLNRLR